MSLFLCAIMLSVDVLCAHYAECLCAEFSELNIVMLNDGVAVCHYSEYWCT